MRKRFESKLDIRARLIYIHQELFELKLNPIYLKTLFQFSIIMRLNIHSTPKIFIPKSQQIKFWVGVVAFNFVDVTRYSMIMQQRTIIYFIPHIYYFFSIFHSE